MLVDRTTRDCTIAELHVDTQIAFQPKMPHGLHGSATYGLNTTKANDQHEILRRKRRWTGVPI
jgi:hypothetical protein